MIFSHLQVALRQLTKNKGLNAIHITGLAIGISAFIFLLLYVQKERRYDRHHDHAENIYRINTDYRIGTESNSMAWTAGALVTHLQQLPDIQYATRLFRYRSPSVLFDNETQKSFSEDNFLWADAAVFNVFSFKFLKGVPHQALNRPNTMIVTEASARRYFGAADPIGKVLTNVTFGTAFEITGVVKDLPQTSHYKADFICSLITLPNLWGDQILTSWGNSFLYSYVKVKADADINSLNEKITAISKKHIPISEDASFQFSLQPIIDIHLYSNIQNEWQSNSDIRYVYILTFAAILILLVSAINYINLWIARAEQRTQEIGIRQAIGSSRFQLASQFIIENLLHCSLAILLSILLVELLQPPLVKFLGEELQINTVDKRNVWIITGLGSLGLIIISTLYPIRVIPRIKPALAIKGTVINLRQGLGIWKGLIGFQIIVATILITAALIIHQQLKFIQEKPQGYDAERLLNISLSSDDSQYYYERFKNELLQHPQIKSASACSHLLGGTLYQSGYLLQTTKQERHTVMWQRIHVDHDYCKTYGIKIIAGRDFSRDRIADTTNFIINETACKNLGLRAEEAVGTIVEYDNELRGEVIGVMSDFHFKTLHSSIEPLILHIVPSRFRMLTVNIDFTDFNKTLEWIKDKWNIFDPSSPLVYTSLGHFNKQNYALEKRFEKLVILFTMIVFLLSSAGLVGLNIYIVNLKRKEIGIRKVLGARITSLLLTLSIPFVWICLISFILSVPICIYSLNVWLSGFAYKVDLSVTLFLITGALVFLICLGSIAIPSLKAALENPVRTLRDN
jgi:putative ABC transport system permease protein